MNKKYALEQIGFDTNGWNVSYSDNIYREIMGYMGTFSKFIFDRMGWIKLAKYISNIQIYQHINPQEKLWQIIVVSGNSGTYKHEGSVNKNVNQMISGKLKSQMKIYK
jgi:hypothetical protein